MDRFDHLADGGSITHVGGDGEGAGKLASQAPEVVGRARDERHVGTPTGEEARRGLTKPR